ncbi:SigB/SigF/SigG family RNA polymerase sigma factor [Tamaricihabitans halophyticus]|uniref:SigB/SigF/SigG family RNA polymerase sigma factor n=1 Tax=Tamaricihabitans halophyticus TaxID=1262583 RepID=UPI0010512EA9|nr:SigB/SigF/SigG family RNA polymerase sigma factor [Tamaricihabitans halophyticus]
MTSTSQRPNEYAHLLPLFRNLGTLNPAEPEHAALRDRLVTEHLPIAKHVARRFANRGQAPDDLVQVATIGLINAVDRYDPNRGTDFLSFAVPTVMGEVRRHFRDTGWAVRVPRRLKELHLAISSASARLAQTLGRAPTPRELAADLGLGTDEVHQGLAASNVYRSVSIDDAQPTGQPELAISDYDDELRQVENREALEPALNALPERERAIVLLRFFGNLSQTQIAERIGISQMHVSRLLTRTLTRLRAELSQEP